jgi:hypothetical protein
MSSATRYPEEILATLLAAGQIPAGLDSVIQNLVGLTVGNGSQPAMGRLVEKITHPQAGGYRSWQLAAFAALLRELDRLNLSLSQLQADAGAASQDAFQQLPGLKTFARRMIEDEKAPMDQRLAAIQLIGRDKAEQSESFRGPAGFTARACHLQTAAIGSLDKFEVHR